MKQLSILELIRIGFFAGIGISIPLTVFTYVPMFFMGDFMMAEFEEGYDEYVEFSPTESGLEAKIEKNTEVESGWVFLGTLTNSGEHEWESVTIQVELFDEEGSFIDESDGYIQGMISSGTTHNFKVTFHACEEAKEMTFSTYGIEVTSAY